LHAPELAKRRIGVFSKGMTQRLGIAQALIGAPELVILDEPTSALDPAGRMLVRDVLDELRSAGTAVVLNSHLLGEVEKSCERVLIILRGSIVKEGAPHDLTRSAGVVVETSEGERTYDNLTRSDVPDLVRKLAADGVDVFRIESVRSSLEDVYLEAVSQPAPESAPPPYES
jgi:ABC-2 type transport system ATP-binding protein